MLSRPGEKVNALKNVDYIATDVLQDHTFVIRTEFLRALKSISRFVSPCMWTQSKKILVRGEPNIPQDSALSTQKFIMFYWNAQHCQGHCVPCPTKKIL